MRDMVVARAEDAAAGTYFRAPAFGSAFADRDAAFAAAAPAALSLAGLFASARRHLLVFAGVFLLVIGLACAVILSLRPSYQSEATLVIDPRQNHLIGLQATDTGSATLSDLNFVRTEMQLLAGDDLARRVVVKLHLQDAPALRDAPLVPDWLTALTGHAEGGASPAAPARPIDAAAARYKARFGTFSDGKSFIISAWFAAADPGFAQAVLRTHLAMFQADQVAAKREAIARAEIWFDQQLTELRDKLAALEARQQAFQQGSQSFRAAGETSAGRQLVTVTNELSEAKSVLAAKAARVRELSAAGMTDTAALSSDLLQRLREQEAKTSQSVAALQQDYDNQYPPLAASRQALADIHTRIDGETQRIIRAASSDLAIARANVAQLQQSFDALSRELGATRGDELTASQIGREIDVDRRLYDELLSRSKQIAIAGQLEEPDTRIVSDASYPLKPSFPRKGMLLAISAAAAALVAAGATAVLDSLRRGLSRSLGEVEAASGLPGLAIIPKIPARSRSVHAKLDTGSALAAALQKLHNSIVLRRDGTRPAITVFASAAPGEGKSLLASLYARRLARPEHPVLLIDADMRRAGLSLSFGVTAQAGLADCLAGRALEECVCTGVAPGLDILTARPGAGDPAALLTQENTSALLAIAAAQYRSIVIDVPPILAVDDCLHIVRQASATVLVVRWGRTPLPILASAVRRLRLAGAELLGVALNGVDGRQCETYDASLYMGGVSGVVLLPKQ
jgi:capsular exopolysaccharide synthesis family protein